MRIVWLDSALNDLESILDYYQDVASIEVAYKQIDKIYKASSLLMEHPYVGHISSLDHSGTILEWVVPKTSYIIPYTVRDDEILIYRIFDAKQDRPGSWDE